MIIPAAGWHLVPTHFVKDVLWRHQVTHWVSVPSVLRLMQPHLQHATKDAHFTHSAGGDDIPTGMLMPMHAPHSCKAAGAAMHWPAASQACNDHWQEAISMEGGAGKLPGSELHALIHEVALRCVVSSGEPLPWALAKRLVASLPSDAILLNLYGESSSWSCGCGCMHCMHRHVTLTSTRMEEIHSYALVGGLRGKCRETQLLPLQLSANLRCAWLSAPHCRSVSRHQGGC